MQIQILICKNCHRNVPTVIFSEMWPPLWHWVHVFHITNKVWLEQYFWKANGKQRTGGVCQLYGVRTLAELIGIQSRGTFVCVFSLLIHITPKLNFLTALDIYRSAQEKSVFSRFAVEHLLCGITFLHRVFCTINTESLQLIHRNDLTIKCKYEIKFDFFDVHRVMKPVVVAKDLQKARRNFSSAHWLRHQMNVKKRILILKYCIRNNTKSTK